MVFRATREEIQRGLVWSPVFNDKRAILGEAELSKGTLEVDYKGCEVVKNGSDRAGIIYTGTRFNTVKDTCSFVLEFTPGFSADDDTRHVFFNDYGYTRCFKSSSDNSLNFEDYDSNTISIPFATYGSLWREGSRNVVVMAWDTTNGHNAWLNGVKILDNDSTTFLGFTGSSMVLGGDFYFTYPAECQFHALKVFNVALEAQEAIDYFRYANYTYNDGATVLLPCDMRNHDPDAGVARDVSGKGNDFTIAGGLEKIDNGLGYRGNGTNAYLTNTAPVVSMTAPWWVALKILNCDDRIFSNGSTSLSDPYFVLRVISGSLLVRMDNDANTTILSATSDFNQLEDGIAHTIIFGDNLGDACLYIDGAKDSTDFSYTPAGTLTLNIAALFCLYQLTPGGYSNGDVLDHRAKQGEVMTPLKALALHNEMMGRVGLV